MNNEPLKEVEEKIQTGPSTLRVQLDGETFEIKLHEGKTILESLLDEGYDPPFSCTAGNCSTCMAHLKKGKVSMDVCYALSEDDIEDGFILTCQSRPLTSELEIDYDI
jgi:ring-1,2-phenylacetyl-CoA epoxidase subunit PaaE